MGFLFMPLFKDWKQCKEVLEEFKLKLSPSCQRNLESNIHFCEEIDERDRYQIIRRVMIHLALESGLWDGQKSVNIWLKEEINEIINMIEYYKVNSDE